MSKQGTISFQNNRAKVEYSTTDDIEFAISNMPGDNSLLLLRKGYRFQLITDLGNTVDLVVADYAKDVQETRVLLKAHLQKGEG